MTPDDIVALEEGALNGWPALHTEAHGGWLWRFADGYTKRANAVLPLYTPAPDDADRRLDAAEAGYRRAGLAPTVKIPAHPAWAPLDARLGARGYAQVDPSLVLTRSLGDARPVPGVTVVDGFSEPWLEGLFDANRVPGAHRGVAAALASRVARPLVGSIVEGSKAVAWAYVALVGEQAWLFDVVVDPDHRRRGLGRQVVGALVHRASAAGARVACLQTFAANAGARALYQGLGFAEVYAYWYRVLGATGGPKVP